MLGGAKGTFTLVCARPCLKYLFWAFGGLGPLVGRVGSQHPRIGSGVVGGGRGGGRGGGVDSSLLPKCMDKTYDGLKMLYEFNDRNDFVKKA